MSKKSKEEEKQGSKVTVKLSGEVLERVLKERAKREEETKKPVSIAEVVNGLLLRRV